MPDIVLAHESAHLILGASDDHPNPSVPGRVVTSDNSLMGNFYSQGSPLPSSRRRPAVPGQPRRNLVSRPHDYHRLIASNESEAVVTEWSAATEASWLLTAWALTSSSVRPTAAARRPGGTSCGQPSPRPPTPEVSGRTQRAVVQDVVALVGLRTPLDDRPREPPSSRRRRVVHLEVGDGQRHGRASWVSEVASVPAFDGSAGRAGSGPSTERGDPRKGR